MYKALDAGKKLNNGSLPDQWFNISLNILKPKIKMGPEFDYTL